VPICSCPLFGEDRKRRYEAVRSHFDPERNWSTLTRSAINLRIVPRPPWMTDVLPTVNWAADRNRLRLACEKRTGSPGALVKRNALSKGSERMPHSPLIFTAVVFGVWLVISIPLAVLVGRFIAFGSSDKAQAPNQTATERRPTWRSLPGEVRMDWYKGLLRQFMGAAMRQKVRVTKSAKSLRRRLAPNLLKQITELQKLRAQVRLAEAAKRSLGATSNLVRLG
jgi:hypothetical protein